MSVVLDPQQNEALGATLLTQNHSQALYRVPLDVVQARLLRRRTEDKGGSITQSFTSPPVFVVVPSKDQSYADGMPLRFHPEDADHLAKQGHTHAYLKIGKLLGQFRESAYLFVLDPSRAPQKEASLVLAWQRAVGVVDDHLMQLVPLFQAGRPDELANYGVLSVVDPQARAGLLARNPHSPVPADDLPPTVLDYLKNSP